MNVNYHILPTRLKRFYSALAIKEFNLLDVGVAHDSVFITKKWFPKCHYYGLDFTDKFLSPAEKAGIDKLFLANLDKDTLDDIPDGFFDVIVMAHVIEHLQNGLDAVDKLCRKLKPGGYFYLEFPSPKSLSLPSTTHQGMHFCDEPTHVKLYHFIDVANVLLKNGFWNIRGGRRRDWQRMMLAPLTFPLQLFSLLTKGKLHGIGLWDLAGFADFVYGEKTPPILPEIEVEKS